jgi:putative Mg2+ transporter-C (MgtC) family protein
VDPNRFFGLYIDPLSIGSKTLALLLSMILSGFIGLERQWRGQQAGLRTHILVGIGATLITITSAEFGNGVTGAHGDPARLAAQIVAGIGFLCAGAVMRTGSSVHGLTTAASIWTVAAIGIAVGGGPRLGEVAVVATLIVLLTLIVLSWLEDKLHLKHDSHLLRIEVREEEHGPARLLGLLVQQGFMIDSVTSEEGAREPVPTRNLQVSVRLPAGFNSGRCMTLLAKEPSIIKYDID